VAELGHQLLRGGTCSGCKHPGPAAKVMEVEAGHPRRPDRCRPHAATDAVPLDRLALGGGADAGVGQCVDEASTWRSIFATSGRGRATERRQAALFSPPRSSRLRQGGGASRGQWRPLVRARDRVGGARAARPGHAPEVRGSTRARYRCGTASASSWSSFKVAKRCSGWSPPRRPYLIAGRTSKAGTQDGAVLPCPLPVRRLIWFDTSFCRRPDAVEGSASLMRTLATVQPATGSLIGMTERWPSRFGSSRSRVPRSSLVSSTRSRPLSTK